MKIDDDSDQEPLMISRISTRSLEFQNGWSALLVGGLFLLPPKTFSTAVGYQVFAEWAPESSWGVLFLTIGACQCLAVVFDFIVLRRISAAFLAILFSIYVIGFVLANPVSAAIPFVVPMIVGQLWAFRQSRRIV